MDLNLLTAEWESKEYRLLDESGELVAIAHRVQSFMSPVAQPAQWIRVHPRVTFARKFPVSSSGFPVQS